MTAGSEPGASTVVAPAAAAGPGTAAAGDLERARGRPASYRHPADVVRVLAGLSAVGLLSILAAGGALSRVERTAFRIVNELPDWLDGPLRGVTQAGWLGAVPVAAAAAVALRRRRIAIDITLAGVGAWVLAKAVKDLAHRGRPGVLLDDVILRGVPAAGHGFVSGHAAVAAALATIAATQVDRRARRALWTLVWLVAVARVYSGAHFPLDVLGGAALGWTVAAAVRLARGTPGRRLPVEVLADGLTAAGLDPSGLRPLLADARGSQPFVIDGGGGGFVKVVGPDQRDADLLFRVGRWLAFREVGDEAPLATPKQQIEHEAYLLLAAARAGARVPNLLATGSAGDGAWFLAEQQVPGADAASRDWLGDEILADAWGQVATLRRARIAHRDLRLANVFVDDHDQVWLLDFGFAQAGAGNDQLAHDVAELIASSASSVGAQRAAAAAVAGVGIEALEAAAPLLQPLALSTATRRGLARQPGLLDEIHQALAAVGVTAEPRPLLRLRLRPAALSAVAIAGYATHHVLVAAVGASAVAAQLGQTRWRWVAVLAVLTALQYAFAAAALGAAATRSLALGRAMASHLASAFAARATLRADASAQARAALLCSHGSKLSDANDAVEVTRASGLVVHVTGLVATAGAASAAGIRVVEPPRAATLVIAALVVSAVAGAVAWLPASRRAVARVTLDRVRQAGRLLAHPRRQRLVAAQLGVTVSLAVGFLAALRAGSVDVATMAALALYFAATAVSAAGPLPGGLGVVEPALAAGLMGLGTPAAQAVAVVVIFRAVTYWLPLIPGALAFARLRRRDCC